MQRNAVLCEGGASQPGRATVGLTEDGQIELTFCEVPEGEPRAFVCSLGGLLDVALGIKKDLASEAGTCLLTKGPGRIIMTVAPWGGPHALYLVSQETYTDALMSMLEAKATQDLAFA